MESPELRPHFTLFVDASAHAAIEVIRAHFEAPACAVHGWVAAPYAELRMPNERDRFWAPRLSIYAEDTAGGAHLICRLGPKPDVWTLYLAGYASMGTCALILALLASSKWALHETATWPALGSGVAAFMVGLLYVSAFVGQRLAREDMRHLHGQLWSAFDAVHDLRILEVEPPPSRVVSRSDFG